MNSKKFLLFLLIIAFFIRAFFGIFLTIKNINPQRDAAGYDAIAVNIFKHGEFAFEQGTPTMRRAPLYPLFLSGIYAVFGHSYLSVRLIQSFLETLTCFLIFLIGKKIFNEYTGFIALILSVIYPFFIYYTGMLLVETLLIFLIAIIIYLMVISIDYKTKRKMVLIGIAFAAAGLCKPTFYPMIFLFSIFLFIHAENKIKVTKYLLLMFVPFIITVVPWGIRNKIVFEKFEITHEGGMQNLFDSLLTANKGSTGLATEEVYKDERHIKGLGKKPEERGNYYFNQFKKLLIKNPLAFIKNAGFKFFRLWRVYPMLGKVDASVRPANIIVVLGFAYYDIILLLSISALVIYRKFSRKIILLVLPAINISIVHMIFSSIPRYRRPAIPGLLILAAGTIFYIIQKLNKKELMRRNYD